MDTAEGLADDFFRDLSPFVASDNQDITENHTLGDSRWDQHSPSLDSQPELSPAESFHAIFARALALKPRLLLSGKRYRFVFFRPGDAFNSETMHRDGWTCDGYSSRRTGERDRFCESDNSRGDAIVRLCLFPALYSWSEDGAQDDVAGDNVQSWVVEYNNFVTEGSLEDAQKPVLVVKAVVLA